MSCGDDGGFELGNPALVHIGDVNDPLGDTGLQDPITLDYLDQTNAVCVVTGVFDANGAAVGGVFTPIAMTYLGGSNGVFYATVPGSFFTVLGAFRRVTMTATATGQTRNFEVSGVIVRPGSL